MTKESISPARIVNSVLPVWYACYTKPRAEKVAAQELLLQGIEQYLPLQRTRRKWSDRTKWVDLPLFRSYIFVHISHEQYNKVLAINSIVRFITFESRAVAIPDSQIEAIKLLLNQGIELEITSENLLPGEKVVVQAGPLMGLQGELIEFRGKRKVLIRIGHLSESILVNIPLELLIKEVKTI